MELDLWSELEELNPGIEDLKLFVYRLLRELQSTRANSSRHSSRVDQIQRALVRQQLLCAELQRENADLRSDNEKLSNYHQEHLETAQQESAEALEVRQQRRLREILRLHEAHEVRTQAIREQHAIEISKHAIIEVQLRRSLGELRDKQAVETAKYEAQWVAHDERESWWVQCGVANDKRIHELEVQLFLSSVFGRANGIIEEHGPLVTLSKFSSLLYAADERAKPAVVKVGTMKLWLQSMPQTFELHGEGQPGYEQVSLRDSTKRPPTEAGLKATARMSDGAGPSGIAPPVHQGSDADTSEATMKLHMGRAAARRDLATGDDRRMLNDIVHARDRDPHKHGHNNFVDEETGRPSKERMRAELERQKGGASSVTPRGDDKRLQHSSSHNPLVTQKVVEIDRRNNTNKFDTCIELLMVTLTLTLTPTPTVASTLTSTPNL